jgi:hypothetical protein
MNRQIALLTSFYFLIALILALLIGSFVWNPQGESNQEVIKSTNRNVGLVVNKSQDINNKSIVSNSINTNKLPSNLSEDPYKEFKEYKATLVKIVNDQDPRFALEKLNSDIPNTKVVQENCHSFTHAIGNAALAKFDNDIAKSIEYNVDVCGGGYIHGIIEKYLQLKPNAGNEILSLCSNPNESGCFHALGHGLMLMNKYDIVASVDGCQKLGLATQKVFCGEGIFMENFDSENAEDSEKPFLSSVEPNKICPNYINPYRSACFYYSGRYIFKTNKNPIDSLQLCKQSPTDQDSADCVRGMSAGILRSDLLNPWKMEKYCDSIPDFYTSCLEGGVNYHLFMLKEESKTRIEMCDKFENLANKSKCLQLIKKSPFRLGVE